MLFRQTSESNETAARTSVSREHQRVDDHEAADDERAEAEMESFVMLSESVRETRRQLQFSVNFQAVLERIIFIFMGEGNRWLL